MTKYTADHDTYTPSWSLAAIVRYSEYPTGYRIPCSYGPLSAPLSSSTLVLACPRPEVVCGTAFPDFIVPINNTDSWLPSKVNSKRCYNFLLSASSAYSVPFIMRSACTPPLAVFAALNHKCGRTRTLSLSHFPSDLHLQQQHQSAFDRRQPSEMLSRCGAWAK